MLRFATSLTCSEVNGSWQAMTVFKAYPQRVCCETGHLLTSRTLYYNLKTVSGLLILQPILQSWFTRFPVSFSSTRFQGQTCALPTNKDDSARHAIALSFRSLLQTLHLVYHSELPSFRTWELPLGITVQSCPDYWLNQLQDHFRVWIVYKSK